MGLCKFCKKWIQQTDGRRKKEFCNNTCRSNFWYSKNKKGKSEKSEPTIEYRKPTPATYDGDKLPNNYTADEPLSFDRLRQEVAPQQQIKIPKTIPQYMVWKRDINTEEEYQELCADVDANYTLNKKQKEFCKTANPSQL
jgi:hypothetical protein